MKKHFALILAATAVAAVAVAAPPTPVFVKNINVGTACQAPVDVIAVAGDLYVLGFNDKKVAKVTTPVGTEGVSTWLDVSAATTWGSGRGPQGIMFNNNEFYISGDNGVDGFIGVYNAAGVEQRKTNLAANRVVCVASLDSDSLVAGRSNSSALIAINKATLVDEATNSALPDVGWRAPIRKIQVDTDGTIYYANTHTTADPAGHKVGKANPGATAGDLTQYTFVQWFAPNESQGSPATVGIEFFSKGGENWVLSVNTGGFSGALPSIDFINKATGVRDLKFNDATNFNGNIRGVTVANIGGTDYLFVANSASPDAGAPNQVHVYSLGAASVADWSIY